MSDHDKAIMNTFMVVLIVLAVLAFAFYFIADTVTSSDDDSEPDPRLADKVRQNIKPVGQVNVGTVAAVASSGGSAADAGPRSGDQVYNAACAACHGTGIAGAPKLGDKAAWAGRAGKGLDGLLGTAISGINAMPPRGTCANCSDDELKSAIEYILKESGV